MTFTHNRLLETLGRLPSTSRYLLAYSGGRDSHVLLHALVGLAAQLPAELQVLHVDHGLQPASARWARHCAAVCAEFGVACVIERLALRQQKGESPEAQARRERYRALAGHLRAGDIVLTAHHQDDQAETVLLQLLRGAGPAGLAAMPLVSRLGSGYLGRPLLQFSRNALQDYALANRLQWVDDASNRDTGLDRNYLRQRVIPLLKERWPACGRTLSRSARHCAEAQALIDTMAADDLAPLLDVDSRTLSSSGIAALPASRGRAVLRAWISGAAFPLPDSTRLDRVLYEVTGAAQDRNPLVHWSGAEVRRYRDRLHLMSPLPPLDPGLLLAWDGRAPLELPAGLGRLCLEQGPGGIALERWPCDGVQIRFRRGGERLRPAGARMSVSVKKLLQQKAVPPWQRSRLPLVYIGNELAAVVDLCVCQPFAAGAGEPGLLIRWEKGTAG